MRLSERSVFSAFTFSALNWASDRVTSAWAAASISARSEGVSLSHSALLILAFQLRRIIGELEKSSQALDPKLRPLFLAQVDKLKTLVDGPNAIPQLRQHELDL